MTCIASAKQIENARLPLSVGGLPAPMSALSIGANFMQSVVYHLKLLSYG